jgi:hypothetical protein
MSYLFFAKKRKKEVAQPPSLDGAPPVVLEKCGGGLCTKREPQNRTLKFSTGVHVSSALSQKRHREAPRGTVCGRTLKISDWNGPPQLDCSAVRQAWGRQSLPTPRDRLIATRHAGGL